MMRRLKYISKFLIYLDFFLADEVRATVTNHHNFLTAKSINAFFTEYIDTSFFHPKVKKTITF